MFAGQQLIENDAQGPDVSCAVMVLAALQTFGRHVLRRASAATARVGVRQSAHAEVGQQWLAVGIDQHVRRLHVQVVHALPVSIGQRTGHAPD